MLTPYQFASNSPISGVDLDGLEFYYAADGKFLGKVGESQEVYTAEKLENGVAINPQSLNVKHDVFLGLAAAISLESGGKKEESLAIGNAHMNFLSNGGSKNLKTLEDIVMFDNTVIQGATSENYKSFVSKDNDGQNEKFGLTSAVNALGFFNGLNGFSDYSNGSDAWDGIDLISATYKPGNEHRGWKWSSDSKSILLDYKKNNNGGVKVEDFTYSDKGYDISAKKVIGKTVFEKYNTPRGGKKQSVERFKKDEPTTK